MNLLEEGALGYPVLAGNPVTNPDEHFNAGIQGPAKIQAPGDPADPPGGRAAIGIRHAMAWPEALLAEFYRAVGPFWIFDGFDAERDCTRLEHPQQEFIPASHVDSE